MIEAGLILFGLALGSFVGTFVWRMQDGRDYIKGRSECESCKTVLGAKDLVPVASWLVYGAKCRYCQSKISVLYPLTELLMAALFVLSYVFWPLELSAVSDYGLFAIWLVSVFYCVCMIVADLKWMLLPDRFIWPLVLLALAAAVLRLESEPQVLEEAIKGVLIAWGFFQLLYTASKGRWIGGGDVKFALSIGIWLGAAKSLVALLLAFYSATLVVGGLLLLKVVNRKDPLPFGPFLIAGFISSFLFGETIIDWYFSNLIFY